MKKTVAILYAVLAGASGFATATPPSAGIKEARPVVRREADATATDIAIESLYGRARDARVSLEERVEARPMARARQTIATAETMDPAFAKAEIPAEDRQSLWQAFSAARRAVEEIPADQAESDLNAGARYLAQNHGQRLVARYGEAGTRIGSTQKGRDWQAIFALTGWGDVTEIATSGTRVEYRRAGITEWIENRGVGFEQGFVVAQRPASASPAELRLDLVLHGVTAHPVEGSSGGFDLRNAAGEKVLAYGEPKAWDADGRTLSASLAVSDDGLAIVVADADARYPLTIDPLITSQEQKLGPDAATGDGEADSRFGRSLALSGDTALVGAYHDDVGANANQGSAYVFVRSGTSWSQQAKLTAGDGAAYVYFGQSVALSGETALVGAYADDVGANGNQGSAYVFVRSGTNWSQQAKLTAGDGAADDYFGYSVAFSGDTALVGANQDDVGANANQGSAYVFVRSGTSWSQQAKLTAGDGAAGDWFGYSVALSGETALVGAHLDDVGANGNQGSAYVFVRSGTSWSQQAQLTAGDGAANDNFGFSVALSGDTCLVGAYSDDDAKGSAYVFVRSGTSWSQQAKLTASDGAAGDYFGISVALSGDTALVGAFRDELSEYTDVGSAYAFVRSGTNWSQQVKLTPGDGAAYDCFGNSVAVSGDTALVGAYGDNVGVNTDQGSAYVFVRNGTSWSQQAKLTAGDGAASDLFGISVALSGDTALVGAYADDVGANADQGSAYVFVRSGTSWSQQAQLTAGDGAAYDNFGFSMALSGDTALVGARLDDVGANGNQGSGYVFVRSGTSWSQQAKLTASDGAASDYFGYSVALSGDTALVGAYADDVGANADQGSAYVFVRSGTNWSQQAKLTAGDGSTSDMLGISVALSGDTALVGAYWDDVGANADQGSAYVFVRSGTIWSQQAKLTASDGAASDYFGYPVALSGDTALVGEYWNDVGANANQGSAYVFVRSGTSWSQQAQLTAGDGAAYDYFGYSVALSGDTALIGAYRDDEIYTPTGDVNVDRGSVYVFRLLTSPTACFSISPNPAACGQAVVFDASCSTGGSQPITNYVWDLDNDGSFDDGSGVSVTNSNFSFGVHPVRLRVTDASGLQDIVTNSLTVSLGNFAPVANAGGPYTVLQGNGVTLDGSGSTDPNTSCGDTLTYAWDVDNNGTFETAGVAPALTWVQLAALGHSTPGTRTVRLLVTDSFGATTTHQTTLTVQSAPNLAVIGNGSTIAAGDVTPSVPDDTDFGTVTVAGATAQRTYGLSNSGGSALNVSGVTTSGTHAADFRVLSYSAAVAASGNGSLVVEFNPSASGTRSATITVNSDDPDTPAYSFAVQGSGLDVNASFGAASLSVTEAVAYVSLPVQMSVAYDATVQVAFAGTAAAGADFAPLTTTLVFRATGPTNGAATFTLLQDQLVEGAETIMASFASVPSFMSAGANPTMTVTVTDDEPTVSLAASPATLSESNGTASVTVSKSSTAGSPLVEVSLGGTATPGADYLALGGPVHIRNPARGGEGQLLAYSGLTGFGNDLVAAGRIGADGGGVATAGLVDIFERNGNLLLTITNPTPGVLDRFGQMLAAAGTNLLVGAEADDTDASDTGIAYLYAPNGTQIATFHNPAPAAGDSFGSTLAMLGTNMVVGAMMDDAGATDSGSVYIFSPDGTLIQTIGNPSASKAGDRFGCSFAVIGTNLLIGAYLDDGSYSDEGRAYLFSPNGTLLTTINNPTPGASDRFGTSVAGAGTNLAVSAYQDSSWGTVYVFSPNGTLLTTINNPAPVVDDRFGYSLSAVGTNLLIGAFFDDASAANAGTAYVYSPNGTLLATLNNPAPVADDRFGQWVASCGDYALVGAYTADRGAIDTGAAYLFSQSGALLVTYTNPAVANGDWFGWPVTAVGTNLLVGANQDDAGGNESGSAYLMSPSGTLLATLRKPTPAATDEFGFSASALGTNMIVSAWGDETDAYNSGRVYIFSPQGTVLATIANPYPAAYDYFGDSVAGVGSNYFVVGHRWDDNGATDGGRAYLYQFVDGTVTKLADINNPIAENGDGFGITVAAVGTNRFLIGANGDKVAGLADAGRAFLYEIIGGNPILLQTITNPAPATGDRFGEVVGTLGTNLLVGAPYDDMGAADAGTAYLYAPNGAVLAVFTNPVPNASDHFGTSVAGSGNLVFIGAGGDDGVGKVHLFTASARLLTTITNPTPASGDQFGAAVTVVSSNGFAVGSIGDDDPGADSGGVWYFSLAQSGSKLLVQLEGATTSSALQTIGLDDAANEGFEPAQFSVANIAGGATGASYSVSLVIVDDDVVFISSPVVVNPGLLVGTNGQPFGFQIVAWHPQSIPETLSITGLPSGASFSSSPSGTNRVGTFTWNPAGAANTYPVRFTATAGAFSTSLQTRIYVKAPAEPVNGQGVPVSQTNWSPNLVGGTVTGSTVVVSNTSVAGIGYELWQSPGPVTPTMTWARVVNESVATDSVQQLSVTDPGTDTFFQVVLAGAAPVVNSNILAVLRPDVNAGMRLLAPPVQFADRALNGTFGDALGAALGVGDRVYLMEGTNWAVAQWDGADWIDLANNNPATNVLRAGQGVLVARTAGGSDPVFTGSVGNRGTNVAQVSNGWNLVGLSEGKPVAISTGFDQTQGGTQPYGNYDETTADVIAILQPDGSWKRLLRLPEGYWLDLQTGASTTNTLQPGDAVYYYRHPAQPLQVRF